VGAGSRCEDGGYLPWHGASATAFYKWKVKYGGMDTSDARRLKTPGDENTT